jgi:hypothetical protein
MKVYIGLISLIFLFFSCAKGYGTTYVSENLTIYYTIPSDLNQVKALAVFWKENELMGKKNQSLRLFKLENGSYQVQLIATKNEDSKTLKFDEIKMLQELENQLNKEVFQKNKIDLVICDSRFKVLNNLNY